MEDNVVPNCGRSAGVVDFDFDYSVSTKSVFDPHYYHYHHHRYDDDDGYEDDI